MLVSGSVPSLFGSVALGVRSALEADGADAEPPTSSESGSSRAFTITFGDSSGTTGLSRASEFAVPVLRGGAAGRSEGKQRISSVAVTALAQLVEDAHIEDVLVPDVCTVAGEETGDSAWFDHSTGVSGVIVDERGNAIEWPWEDQAQERRPTGKRVRHTALDRIIVNGLMHASVKGDMGANSTGVRRWKVFCASEGVAFARALEAHAPLRLKLQEEWLCMRFVASLVETGVSIA